ncbi:MAG: hypothetical protein EBU29_13300, partial [Gammaproteobacteria bacterium]|nr:hypothetical protein [Gammaproteobacteria bacterium]
SVNANQLWFDDTSVLEAARNQGNIDREIGTDLSLSIVWRPMMIQNVVFRLSGAALLPGDGFEDLFGSNESAPLSILANMVLTY